MQADIVKNEKTLEIQKGTTKIDLIGELTLEKAVDLLYNRLWSERNGTIISLDQKVAEHDWLKQWLLCDFLVAESDEPICIPRRLQKVCGVTTADICCDASQTGL